MMPVLMRLFPTLCPSFYETDPDFLLIRQFLIRGYFGKKFLKHKKMLIGLKYVSNNIFLSLPIK